MEDYNLIDDFVVFVLLLGGQGRVLVLGFGVFVVLDIHILCIHTDFFQLLVDSCRRVRSSPWDLSGLCDCADYATDLWGSYGLPVPSNYDCLRYQ